MKPDELSVRYDIKVGVFDESFDQHYFDMYFNNVFIQFDMHLDDNFELLVDWDAI